MFRIIKTKTTIFSLLICFIAQNVYSAESLPDAFYIEKADITYYEDISLVLGNIRDSIENPKAYLIEDEGNVMIAIKKENKYTTFHIVSRYCQEYEYEFERKNINNIGNDELIVYCQCWNSKSGLTGGFSEYSARIFVWDIDSYNCLLDFVVGFEYSSWWQEWSQEDLPYEEREIIDSGGESECYNYAIELEKMQLIIQEDEDCPNGVYGKKKYGYKLTKSGFALNFVEELVEAEDIYNLNE